MSRPTSATTRPLNTQTRLFDSHHGRILCVADIRGRLSALNDLAREANAVAIIHTGDFGFFEHNSLERINDRTLRHLTMYSPLIPSPQRTHLLAPENPPALIRQTVTISLLSEFPLLLSGQIKLNVPVYTTWGACEDVLVLEKFRTGQYNIDNLHVIDEASTRLVDVGGVKLRLLALGGALVPHKLFDNGDGNATIAGGQGTMWATALQIGELVDTAQRVHDPSETRVLVTHASPGREGIISQLALVVKADLTISAGLHFRYATSYNEFSVQHDISGFREKLLFGKEQFDRVWHTVKTQVDMVIDEQQRVLLEKALSVVERIPPLPGQQPQNQQEEPAWKNCWNWNLCDAAFGSLVLDVKEGRVSAELKSQGFNYAYRRSPAINHTPNSQGSGLPSQTPAPPTKASTPALPPAATSPAPAVSVTPAAPSAPSPAPAAKTPAAATPPQKPATPVQASSPTASTPVEREGGLTKAEKIKAKKKEKREREKAERAAEKAQAEKDGAARAITPAGVSETASPASPALETEELKSPTTDTNSAGVRTPRGTKPARNPWTIFMRMPGLPGLPTEAELREFFGEASAGITKITIPAGGPQVPSKPKIAYIEFGDEQAMKAGLEKHAEKFKDIIPDVMQATDPATRHNDAFNTRGRGRGRGAGGFAARGFAAAGLTRKVSDRASANGGANGSAGGSAGAGNGA